MKQQVIILHGGATFDNYEKYLADLRGIEMDFERVRAKRWRSQMADDLGDSYDVICPRMPNPDNAKYLEWRIYFEKMIPFFAEHVILVGHSLGAIFLAKYLSENSFVKKIKAVFLIAAPFGLTTEYSLADFLPIQDFSRLAALGDIVHLYHSEDDPVVPFSDLEKYRIVLPKTNVRVFTDRGHFNQASFPELVADIRQVG